MAFTFLKNKKSTKPTVVALSNSTPTSVASAMCENGKVYSIVVTIGDVDYVATTDKKKQVISVLKDGDAEAFGVYTYWLKPSVQDKLKSAGADSSLTVEKFLQLRELEDAEEAVSEAWNYITRVTVANIAQISEEAEIRQDHNTNDTLEYKVTEIDLDVPDDLALMPEDINTLVQNEVAQVEQLSEALNVKDNVVFDNILVSEDALNDDSTPAQRFVTSAVVRSVPLDVMKSMSTGFFWSDILDTVSSFLSSGFIATPHDDEPKPEAEPVDTDASAPVEEAPQDKISSLMDSDDFTYDTDVFSEKAPAPTPRNVPIPFENIISGEDPVPAPELDTPLELNVPSEPLASDTSLFFTEAEEKRIIDVDDDLDTAEAVEAPVINWPTDEEVEEHHEEPVAEEEPAPETHIELPVGEHVSEPVDETPAAELDLSKVKDAEGLREIAKFTLNMDRASAEDVAEVEALLQANIENETKIAHLNREISSHANTFLAIDIENISDFFDKGPEYSADSERKQVSEDAFFRTQELEKERESVIQEQVGILHSLIGFGDKYKHFGMSHDVLDQRITELVNVKNTAFDSEREAVRDHAEEFENTIVEIEKIDESAIVEPVAEDALGPLPRAPKHSAEKPVEPATPSIFNDLAAKYGISL